MPLSCAPRTSASRTTFGATAPAKSRTAMPSSPQRRAGRPAVGTTQTPSSTQPIASPTWQACAARPSTATPSIRLSLASAPSISRVSLSPPEFATRSPAIWLPALVMRRAALLRPSASMVRVCGRPSASKPSIVIPPPDTAGSAVASVTVPARSGSNCTSVGFGSERWRRAAPRAGSRCRSRASSSERTVSTLRKAGQVTVCAPSAGVEEQRPARLLAAGGLAVADLDAMQPAARAQAGARRGAAVRRGRVAREWHLVRRRERRRGIVTRRVR